MFFFWTFTVLLSWLLFETSALPLADTSKMQTLTYQQSSKPFTAMNNQEQSWSTLQEYDMYSNLVEHYENLVDITLNSESEELLLNLIYKPRESMNLALTSQAAYLGFDSLTEKQLLKMPSIIGKHVQAMNAKVFNSVEPSIKLFWRTIWDPKMLSVDHQSQEHIMSFLASFNGIIAKKLMDQMDDYNLLKRIRQELISISASDMEEEQLEKDCSDRIWIGWCVSKLLPSRLVATKLTKTNIAGSQSNFLGEHLSDLRTNLLMELHIQFMDFYVRIQSDIIDTLSLYYNYEQ